MNNKVICFGSVGKDIFFPTNEGKITETPRDLLSQKKITFELGAKYKVDERFESLGGCAANMAAGLAKLGIGSACASTTGSDLIGNWVCGELKKNNVEIKLVTQEENRKSKISAIIVDRNSADRIIFVSSGDSSGEVEISAEKVKDAGWFFVSDVQGKWKDQLEKIFALAKAENKKIAFNPRENSIHEDVAEIIKMIGMTEVLFVNKDEAMEIVSSTSGSDPEMINDEKYLLEKLKTAGAKIVALTDGVRGAWTSDGEVFLHAEIINVKAIDATGAGDAFSSSFLAAYLKGKNLEDCLKWGIAGSVNVVKFYGGIEGGLNEEEIEGEAKKIEVKKI